MPRVLGEAGGAGVIALSKAITLPPLMAMAK
jgi:hypothetical protein